MEKISETVYDQLRLEWTEKIQNAEQTLANAEREAATHLDDLDSALSLMTIISKVYELLANKQRANLLRILIKRLIVDRDGLIINHELNSPFAYLHSLVVQDLPASLFSNGSSHIHQKGNQSPRSHSSFSDVETFLAGLRFEKRNLLNDLPGNLLNGKLN